MSNKKYGLILPDKAIKQPTFKASRNVFGDDDSDEENQNKKHSISTLSKRQAKATQSKAVIEDPTVYQYDEIYDNIKEKVNEEKQKAKTEKNPRYIESLLKSAHKRKLENERRIERQVQKEREKEGDEFADKDVFVTSAYKKKLEEMRKEDEKEKYEEYLESIGDVTKQKDLGGFYRHLYEQKLGSVKEQQGENIQKSPKASEPGIVEEVHKNPRSKSNRNYRKRKNSADNNKHISEGEIISDEEINRINLSDIKAAKKKKDENLDADSDFSVNDPTDDESENCSREQVSIQEDKEKLNSDIQNVDNKAKLNKEEDQVKEVSPPIKIKVDIWKKRTVGVVFEEALKRYYERKAAKSL